MPRHFVYRDYRPGKTGQFASEASYNRSRAQGVKCHVHKEYLPKTIDSVDDLFAIEDDDNLEPEEFHGTGDTGEFQ